MSGNVHGLYAGTLFGFPIYVESSALYIAPWVTLIAFTQSNGHGLLSAFIFVALIVASVLVHELAHALAARALGVPVRHIALTWFGGYASFWVQPTRWRDAAIAFAGPASNLAVAAILLAGSANVPAPHAAQLIGSDIFISSRAPGLLEQTIRMAAYFNLAMGAFNLLPGLPLDGGHILRAALAMRMSWGRAGWIAAWAGVLIGAAAAAYAIWIESFTILFLGLFVAGNAWLERRTLRSG